MTWTARVVEDADQRIAVTRDLPDRMTVDGEPLDPPPGLTLMLHKPLGVTCSHKEAGSAGLRPAAGALAAARPGLSTIGRLDKETSGLLLLTDDGALLHRIISPRSHVPKRYRVTLARPLRGDEAKTPRLRDLDAGQRRQAAPAGRDGDALADRAPTVTLTEGRYHQVRRMFAALGNHVVALHRDRVGGLALPDDLAPGSYRVLGAAELSAVLPPR